MNDRVKNAGIIDTTKLFCVMILECLGLCTSESNRELGRVVGAEKEMYLDFSQAVVQAWAGVGGVAVLFSMFRAYLARSLPWPSSLELESRFYRVPTYMSNHARLSRINTMIPFYIFTAHISLCLSGFRIKVAFQSQEYSGHSYNRIGATFPCATTDGGSSFSWQAREQFIELLLCLLDKVVRVNHLLHVRTGPLIRHGSGLAVICELAIALLPGLSLSQVQRATREGGEIDQSCRARLRSFSNTCRTLARCTRDRAILRGDSAHALRQCTAPSSTWHGRSQGSLCGSVELAGHAPPSSATHPSVHADELRL